MVAVYARALARPAASREASPAQPPAGEQAAPEVSGPASGPLAERVARETVVARELQRQHMMELKWDRDPFTRGAFGVGLSGLSLSGILWDTTQPIAIINGTTVQVGEEVEGYRVVEISEDHVSVSDGADSFQLRIAP
jgi:hypothetical protein